METGDKNESGSPDDSTPDVAVEPQQDSSPDTGSRQVDTSDATEPTSIRDIVRSVSQQTDTEAGEGSDSSADKKEDVQTKVEEEPSSETTESEEEGVKDVPFNNHPRFKKLIKQKEELKKKAEEFETDATAYRQVQEFMKANSLSNEEAAETFLVAGLLKSNPEQAWARMADKVSSVLQQSGRQTEAALLQIGQLEREDPIKAWELMKPIAKRIMDNAGLKLPNDLAQRVSNGEISERDAREVSQARIRQQSLERQVQAEQQQAQNAQAAQVQSDIRTATALWEQNKASLDSDYASKQADMMTEVQALMFAAGGRPKTTQQAVDIMEKAYAAVNARLSRYTPPKPPKEHFTGDKSQAATSVTEPKSVRDAVRLVARGSA